MEATQGGHCCKLLQPMGDRCIVIGDLDTIKEDVDAVYGKAGVKVGQRQEVFQGRHTDGPIQ